MEEVVQHTVMSSIQELMNGKRSTYQWASPGGCGSDGKAAEETYFSMYDDNFN